MACSYDLSLLAVGQVIQHLGPLKQMLEDPYMRHPELLLQGL